MKKSILFMGIVFAAQAQKIGGPLQPTAADWLLAKQTEVVSKALTIAETNKPQGCALMTNLGGGLSAALGDEENKKVAAAQCCDHWKKTGDDKKHPNAYHSICEDRKSLTDYVKDAAKFAIEQPAVRCPVVSKLGSDVKKLPKAEREKLCKACGSRWPADSKAKFEVCGMESQKLPKKLEDEDFLVPEDEDEESEELDLDATPKRPLLLKEKGE